MSPSRPPRPKGATGGLRLRYGPTVTDVTARDPDVLVWLAEFFAPSFEVAECDANSPDHRVAFRADPERIARLVEARDTATDVLDAFTLDGRFTQNPTWTDEDGSTWVADEERDLFLRTTGDASRIDVVAGASEGPARILLMRVVRELAASAMVQAGCLPVHGAAIVVDDEVVLICGPKRAGKTTLLVHALHCGAAFAANDRVFVDGLDPAMARGMPTIIKLRSGTVDRFEGLRSRFETARYDWTRTLRSCAPGIDRPDGHIASGGRRGISGAQLCRLADVRMERGGRVRAVLFPRIDASIRGLVVERRSPAASLDDMRGSLLKPSNPTRTSNVLTPRGESVTLSVERESELCRRLIEHVPVYTCRLGPDAYEHDLLGALADAGCRRRPHHERKANSPHGFAMEAGSAALLTDAGLHPVRSRLVQERRTRVGRRALYRVDLADGRVKLRRYAKPERVAVAFQVRRQLEDPAFSRVLASSETLTLEEWIEGTPLEPDACDPATVREAARLLARLHAAPITGVAEYPPGGWPRRSVDALVRLGAGGLLPTHVLERLRDRLARDEPATSRVGAVHSDFCAENMLRDTSAALRVFDNEGVHFGALGYDLGRTWYRWPLPSEGWRLFLATYREALPNATPDGELDYWRTVAAVQAAAVRSNWSDGLEAALDRLRDLAS